MKVKIGKRYRFRGILSHKSEYTGILCAITEYGSLIDDKGEAWWACEEVSEECKHENSYPFANVILCNDCGYEESVNDFYGRFKEIEKQNAELKNELMQIKMLLKEEGLLDAWEAAGMAAKLLPKRFSDVLSNKDKEN